MSNGDIPMPKLVAASRIANILNAAFLMVVGILYFVLTPGSSVDIPASLSACYVILFGVIMLCFEVHWGPIHRIMYSNFSFMFSVVGRMLFFVLAGTLAFGLDIPGIVAGAVTLANLVFNIFVMCSNPQYAEQMRRQNAEWELQALNSMAKSASARAATVPAPAPTPSAAPSAFSPTSTTTTSAPAPPARPAPATTQLPSGWEKVTDPSGGVYYYNNSTQQTSWEPPV